MANRTTATFKIESWDEEPYVDQDGAKLSRASVKQTFAGDIEGDGQVEFLMCYRPDQTADYVGLNRVVGRVAGRSGSFVLQSTGTFDGREAKGPLSVVPGSGTGELSGIAGRGDFSAPMGGEPSLALDLEFA